MAETFETIGGVAVIAEQFAPDLGQIPAACAADGQSWRGEGWRVDTARGIAFPVSGDWVVTIDEGPVVMSEKAFAALFASKIAKPKAPAKGK